MGGEDIVEEVVESLVLEVVNIGNAKHGAKQVSSLVGNHNDRANVEILRLQKEIKTLKKGHHELVQQAEARRVCFNTLPTKNRCDFKMPEKGWIVASIVVVIAIIASWSFVIPLSSNGVYVDSDNVHNFTVGDEYEIMENQRVLIEEKDIKIERQRALLEEKDVEIKRLFQSYEVNKTAIESFSVPDKHQGNTWGFYFWFYFYMFCIVWMVCKCLCTNPPVKQNENRFRNKIRTISYKDTTLE